jgi:hypothetical protein
MGFQNVNQLEPEGIQQTEIALRVLAHGVDDDGFSRIFIRKEVGVSARDRILELAENQGVAPAGNFTVTAPRTDPA